MAEKDLRLYATAIHTQALLIQQGKLLLDVFTPTMRTLLKQVRGWSAVAGRACDWHVRALLETSRGWACLRPPCVCVRLLLTHVWVERHTHTPVLKHARHIQGRDGSFLLQCGPVLASACEAALAWHGWARVCLQDPLQLDTRVGAPESALLPDHCIGGVQQAGACSPCFCHALPRLLCGMCGPCPSCL